MIEQRLLIGFPDQHAAPSDGGGDAGHILDLPGGDVVKELENVRTTCSPCKSRCLKPEQAFHGLRPFLPVSCRLLGPDDISIVGSYPVDSGATADIWAGVSGNGSKVTIKHYRYYATAQLPQTIQRVCSTFLPFLLAVLKWTPKFYREVVIWNSCSHPNIVPFLGVTCNPPQLISDWMPGGNITEYLCKNPGADRYGFVCFLPAGEIKSSIPR